MIISKIKYVDDQKESAAGAEGILHILFDIFYNTLWDSILSATITSFVVWITEMGKKNKQKNNLRTIIQLSLRTGTHEIWKKKGIGIC